MDDGRLHAGKAPMVRPGHTAGTVTAEISSIVLTRGTPGWWWIAFAVAFTLVMLFLYAITYLFIEGVGIWGINIPVAWGFAIINFAWWIGIGHAGTLISAVLLLLHQEWRRSISRFAEAMTLFALANAALFPILHLGRPWLFYWLAPYPNTMGLWPQWRSALVWDFFAITVHVLVSVMFWYMGLIPDLAAMRDRARKGWVKKAYAFLAMGWRGDAHHWERYHSVYYLLAALTVPLIISVQSIIGMDFATAIVPGWHSTLFAPSFVAAALFSALAMVATIVIPLRVALGLRDLITMRHLDNLGKLILASGLLVAYSYVMELFMAWYSGSQYQWSTVLSKMLGNYAPLYWTMIAANVGVIQALWLRRVRDNPALLFVISLVVNVGMWLDRVVIVVSGLYRDYLPSAWHLYAPTVWDWALFIGTIGLFLALMYLFIRLLPVISIYEMEELVEEEGKERARAVAL